MRSEVESSVQGPRHDGAEEYTPAEETEFKELIHKYAHVIEDKVTNSSTTR
jgi:hypothetical protein